MDTKETYDDDDPMLIVLQDREPVDTPLKTASLCCRLLPSLLCFHCRTCRDCFKEMDCLSAVIILLPFLSGLIGVAVGLGVGAGVVFRDGYYNYYGWHNARDSVLPFAIGSIVLSGVLFWFHPRPLYCMRVQRNPPIRVGITCKLGGCSRREIGSLSTNRREVARRRSGRLRCGTCEAECLPLLLFLPFLSVGLWTMFLFSLNNSLGYIPMCVVALVSGATTKFSRSRCRRLTRVCCGRTTYEIVSDVNPMGGWDESEEDEDEWRLTSGSEEEESDESDSMSDLSNDEDRKEEKEEEEDSSDDEEAGVTIDAENDQKRQVKGAGPNMRKRGGVFEV